MRAVSSLGKVGQQTSCTFASLTGKYCPPIISSQIAAIEARLRGFNLDSRILSASK